MPEQTPESAAALAPETTPTVTSEPIAPEQAPPAPEDTMSFSDALDRAIEDAEKKSKEPDKKEEAPEEKKEEKPEEQKPEQEDTDAKNMSKSAGERFKQIKSEAHAARARVAELEAKLKELEANPKPATDEAAESLRASIAEKEAKLAEYEKELSVVKFESTNEYKRTVVEPMAAIIGVVERVAKKYEVTPRALMALLEETDSDAQGDKIAEVAANFSERDRVSLYNLADDYAAVLAQRDELRSNAAKALEAREASRREESVRATEAAKKQWEQTAKTVWDTLKAKVPLPESEDERAKFEKEAVDQVAKLRFDDVAPDQKAFAAYAGVLLPEVVKQNKLLASEIAALKESLKKYSSATPGATAGAPTKNEGLDPNLSFLDAIEQRFSGS